MAEFKCPMCGRQDLETGTTGLAHPEGETGGAGDWQKPGEVRCRACGWVGTPADLKQSY